MMFYYIQKYIYDKAYIYYKALLSIPHRDDWLEEHSPYLIETIDPQSSIHSGFFFIERKVRASVLILNKDSFEKQEFHKNSIKFHMKLIRKYKKKKNVGFMKL